METTLEIIFHTINAKLTPIIVSAKYTDCNNEKEFLDFYEMVNDYCGYITSVNRGKIIFNDTDSSQDSFWYNHIIGRYNHFIDKTECYDDTPIGETLRPVFILTEDFIESLSKKMNTRRNNGLFRISNCH